MFRPFFQSLQYLPFRPAVAREEFQASGNVSPMICLHSLFPSFVTNHLRVAHDSVHRSPEISTQQGATDKMGIVQSTVTLLSEIVWYALS